MFILTPQISKLPEPVYIQDSNLAFYFNIICYTCIYFFVHIAYQTHYVFSKVCQRRCLTVQNAKCRLV